MEINQEIKNMYLKDKEIAEKICQFVFDEIYKHCEEDVKFLPILGIIARTLCVNTLYFATEVSNRSVFEILTKFINGIEEEVEKIIEQNKKEK